MIVGLSAPAVYHIYVQIHYSIKYIEIRRQIRKIDAIFKKIRIQFAKTLFTFSGNQFAKNWNMQQMDIPDIDLSFVPFNLICNKTTFRIIKRFLACMLF